MRVICQNENCKYYNNGKPHWDCKHMNEEYKVKRWNE